MSETLIVLPLVFIIIQIIGCTKYSLVRFIKSFIEYDIKLLIRKSGTKEFDERSKLLY